MPDFYPPYIFGMHDRGGAHLMVQKGKPGWVLVTEALGADPDNHSGSNYTDLVNQGLSVIVRLNYGYAYDGTLPPSHLYANFAVRCGNFVAASPGCHIWIVGNETNLANERPGGRDGEKITPALYADCYRKCRDEIRRRPDHTTDQVVVAPVAPWNIETPYPGNPSGDWVQYFADILHLLGGEVDAIGLHTYTHGQDPNFVTSDATMGNPAFQKYHYHFRAYRDFMAAIPETLRDRPVYITETDENDPWKPDNTGWVRNAYREIHDWNQNPDNQPIQALILYRWIIADPNSEDDRGWAIVDKPGVQDDFRCAMDHEYRVLLPRVKPEYRADWVEVGAPGRMDPAAQVTFGVAVRNEGRATWGESGAEAVQVGYRWIDAAGGIIEGARAPLPRAVAPGETVRWPDFAVQASNRPGFYTLELDLIHGVSGWFADLGSPIGRVADICVGDRYRVAWLMVDAPPGAKVGESRNFPVRIRNEGALTWIPTGSNPVCLTYQWLNANRQIVIHDGQRTVLGRPVAPGEELTLEATVQFPAERGQYILRLDMVCEHVTWFQSQGSVPYEIEMEVEPAQPDYAAEWIEFVGPKRLVAGEQGTGLVKVRNAGTQRWPKAGDKAIRLGYRWLDAEGIPVSVTGARIRALPKAVEPGDTATWRDVGFVTPLAPGAYRLVWDLVQGGVWLSAEGMATMEQPFQIVSSKYGVEWQVLQPWPHSISPGEELRTSLRLRNTGTATWAAGGEQAVSLVYHWFAEDGKPCEPWDALCVRLPHDVAPGQPVDLDSVAFRTPPVPADYILRWDLMEAGRTWFFRQGGAPLEVRVEVADEALLVPWTAQASHNAADAGLAFDGDPDTVWDSQAGQAPGMWFQVDLGEVRVLDRVKVASPGRGFPMGYRVKLSEDGQDWHLVAEELKNRGDIDVAFPPCGARHLRLEQTGTPEWPATWQINGIAISATGAWAGAGASHYAADVYKAMDARLQTAWNTRVVKQIPGMWFQLDMGSVREIERVALEHPGKQMPRGYIVQISTDGQNWQEVGRKDENWDKLVVQFQPVTARYIRVETTNSSPYQPWGIAEFVVWRSSPTWLRGAAGG